MRTTVDIPDETYRRLKLQAVMEGRSIRQIVLRGIQREIEGRMERPVKRLGKPILKSYVPGSIHIDSEHICDLIGFP